MGRGDGTTDEQTVTVPRRVELDPAQPLVGRKRPFMPIRTIGPSEDYGFTKAPVPWINWKDAINEGIFVAFDAKALQQLKEADYQLCGICGEHLGEEKVYGCYGKGLENPHATTGPGMHPHCALLSYHYCPYLKQKGEQNAFVIYQGPGHGLQMETIKKRGWLMDDEDLSEVDVTPEAKPITVSDLKQLTKQQSK